MLLSCSDDMTVRLWDVLSGKELCALTGHTKKVSWSTFNRAGDLVASCSDDNTVRLWQVKTQSCIATLEGHVGRVSIFSFFGKRFVVLLMLIICAGNLQVEYCAFNSTGTSLATCSSDKFVIIWNVAEAKQVTKLEGHTKKVQTKCKEPHSERFKTRYNLKPLIY
jgi:WD40 repeat protein